MPILLSDVHAALGVASGPLTYEMIEQAARANAVETQRLDWKAGAPGEPEEIAKDLAAFANAQGGLIVYGVEEDRETGRAKAISDISTGDSEIRRIRAAAMAHIYPRVHALEIEGLLREPGATDGVIAVEVRPSRQGPHLVGRSDRGFRAPLRSGTQTTWMEEWEIARAYADRARHTQDLDTRLENEILRTREHLDLAVGVWIVGAATLSEPPILGNPTLAKEDVLRVAEDADSLRHEFAPADQKQSWAMLFDALGTSLRNPRVGLRRWVVREGATGPADRSQRGHFELHHDGTVTYAVPSPRGMFPIEGKQTLAYPLAAGFAADFIGVLEVVGRRLGGPAESHYRIELARESSQPIAMVSSAHSGRFGGTEQPDWSRDVQRFEPVSGTVTRATDTEVLAAFASTIALDITAQFGLQPP